MSTPQPHVIIVPKNPNPGTPPKDLAAMDSDDAAITVTFTNYSTTQWSLGYWGYDYQEGFSGPSQSPSNPLDANDGQQTFAQSQVLSWLDQGPISIFCTWYDSNNYRFGIKLTAHFQMVGIGYRPSWEVSVDQNGGSDSEPSWQSNGDDPSSTYTWNTAQIPYSIVATPNSQHTSLSVSVEINNISSNSQAL